MPRGHGLSGHFDVSGGLSDAPVAAEGFAASFEAGDEVRIAAFSSFFPSISETRDEGVWQQLVPLFVPAAKSVAGDGQSRPSVSNAIAIRQRGGELFIMDFTHKAPADLGKVPIACACTRSPHYCFMALIAPDTIFKAASRRTSGSHRSCG